MDFEAGKAIFQQIADLVCENILREKWNADDRIPSVRDMAVAMEVNPNTMMRAYAYLQDEGIIYNKRGVGYFVAGNALNRVVKLKKDEFLRKDVPRLFRDMDLLGISINELMELHAKNRGEEK